VPSPLRVGRKARHLVRFHRVPPGAVETAATTAAGATFGAAVADAIESGHSIYAVGELCGSLPAGVRTFADYETMKHAPQNIFPQCRSCGTDDPDLRLTEWSWQSPADGNRTNTPGIAVLMALSGHVHLGGGKPVVFQTYHAFCRRCLRSATSWRYLASVMTLPLGLFLFVAFMVMISGFALGLAEKNHDSRMMGWYICAGGAVLLAISIWLFQFFNKRRVPASLREICRTPFRLKKVKSLGPLFEQEAAT